MLKLGMVVPITEYNFATGELFQKTNMIVDRWAVVITRNLPREYYVIGYGREEKSGWQIELASGSMSVRMRPSIARLRVSLYSWYGGALAFLSRFDPLAAVLLKDKALWRAIRQEFAPLTKSGRLAVINRIRELGLIGPMAGSFPPLQFSSSDPDHVFPAEPLHVLLARANRWFEDFISTIHTPAE